MKTTTKTVEELIETNESPISLDVIPNYMGINLCSVEALSWTRLNDGQLVNLTIHFLPDLDKDRKKDPKKPESFPLVWFTDCDEDGNTIWEAASPYNDEGTPFYYRIRQRLYNDKIEYYEDSDDILVNDDSDGAWDSLDEAKDQMQKEANVSVKEFRVLSKLDIRK